MQPQIALFDYAKLYKSAQFYTSIFPTSGHDIQRAVLEAIDNEQAIRVRASAHTLGGVTLPRKQELLIRTNRLDHYRFEEPGTITVGAGAIVWDVRDFVQQYGWQMPVYNGGWAGPTVGGYVSAGGMGLRIPPADRIKLTAALGAEGAYLTSISEAHGGFWEHVASVTLVDGTGTIREIKETEPVFQWLFGSFGQLGIIYEAKLKLFPLNEEAPALYPMGQSGTIPRVQIDDPKINDDPPDPENNSILFWFSYLVRAEQETEAWDKLELWACRSAPARGRLGRTGHRQPTDWLSLSGHV